MVGSVFIVVDGKINVTVNNEADQVFLPGHYLINGIPNAGRHSLPLRIQRGIRIDGEGVAGSVARAGAIRRSVPAGEGIAISREGALARNGHSVAGFIGAAGGNDTGDVTTVLIIGKGIGGDGILLPLRIQLDVIVKRDGRATAA